MKSQSELKLVEKLNTAIEGDVLSGPYHCGRYATDASVYQMMPLGVVLPKTHEDVKACLEIAKACGTAVLARGGGTSQCGQTVNQALVIDHSRYLRKWDTILFQFAYSIIFLCGLCYGSNSNDD